MLEFKEVYTYEDINNAEHVVISMEIQNNVQSLNKIAIPIFEDDYQNDTQKRAFEILRKVMIKELRNYKINQICQTKKNY